VLDADRQALAAHAPRYADVPWAGVAAAPDLGDVSVDSLVDLLETELPRDCLEQRNALRAWEFRLNSMKSRYENAATGAGRAARVNALRENRLELARRRRVAKSERAIALRSQIQQARVQLSYFARHRCSSVRSELQEDAGGITRRTLRTFPTYVARRAVEVVGEVDDGISEHLSDVANELGLPVDSLPPAPDVAAPEVGEPPLKSRRLETRLMMLLGAGFGLGVALTLSRIFADLAAGLTVVGIVSCVLVGLVVTVWVVGIRGLLHDRAVLDRWVGEVTAGLRAIVDQAVASRVLAAETALTTSLAAYDEADEARVAAEVKAIDAELREHAMAGARATAVRDAEVPAVRRALEAVRVRLAELAPGQAPVRVQSEGLSDEGERRNVPAALDGGPTLGSDIEIEEPSIP
jgi:hypothetical protein